MLITRNESPADRLIVALDVPSSQEALAIVDSLEGTARFFKVGLELFVAAGPSLVDELTRRGHRVFLDLKMDDIEETIARAVAEITRHDATLITIQGSVATVRAAVRGRGSSPFPKVLLVTLLSSLGEADVVAMRLVGPGTQFRSLDEYVDWRATTAIDAGCDGLIASGETVGRLRSLLGPTPMLVVPGIRPSGGTTDDHKRSLNPRQAIAAGADYLVVGRPIRNAPPSDRRGVVQSIIADIADA